MATSKISVPTIIKKEYTSISRTIGANDEFTFTKTNFGISEIQGYTPIAFYRFTSGAANVAIRSAVLDMSASVSGVLTCVNLTSSAITTSPKVGVIWMRSDMIRD